jgi:hypothetical protein
MIMASGRPRTVSLSDEEMINLGKEMVSYVTKNKKTILHLCEWYTIEKGFTYNEWKTFIQRPEFVPYYEQALKIVGMKYVDKNSNVRDGISQRWQRVYFGDLKESEDADMDAEAARRASALKSETKAIEEEKQKVLESINRNRKFPS